MLEALLLGVFAAALVVCVSLGLSILWALALGYALFFGYGLYKKYSLREMLALSLSGVRTVKNVLAALLLIGVLTAVWRAGGTIACIVYHATRVCTPAFVLPLTFLLCCAVSALTGTAFGTAATVGVICVTLAGGMGVPPALSGGAMLAGAFFGDRCSPMSTSALLVSELTGTSIFRNLGGMVKTSLVPFFVSLAFYAAAGLLCETTPAAADVRAVFATGFDLDPLVLIPAAVILLLSAFRLDVKLTMAVSVAAGAAVTLFVQHMAMPELLQTAVWGYRPADAALAALLGGGGIVSMAKVMAIICLSSCYAGIFGGTGFLDGIRRPVAAAAERLTPFGAMLAVSLVTSMISCNQTLATMLTHQLCGGPDYAGEDEAIDLENTVVVVSPLVPWSIAGAVPLATVGAPLLSLLAACYLWLLPLWNLLRALRRRTAARPKAG